MSYDIQEKTECCQVFKPLAMGKSITRHVLTEEEQPDKSKLDIRKRLIRTRNQDGTEEITEYCRECGGHDNFECQGFNLQQNLRDGLASFGDDVVSGNVTKLRPSTFSSVETDTISGLHPKLLQTLTICLNGSIDKQLGICA